MTAENLLLVHYWQLPPNLFVSLKPKFHDKLCNATQVRLSNKHKNCACALLDCQKWHAQRLFTRYIRMTLKELEILRQFAGVSQEETQKEIESIGCHGDGTIIRNPKLPFNMKDLIYVAAHLMFDGSYRDKGGCYFYAYEPSLAEYHKKRLSLFGEIPINFIAQQNQLYFSHTLGYIAKSILEIDNFRSTKTYFSDKMKELIKNNKCLADEVVKALIIDEGNIEDKIEAELANKRLAQDIITSCEKYYNFTKLTYRTRTIGFKNNLKWTHTATVWNIGLAAASFQNLYNSIFPLPINYKNENLEFLFKRQNRDFNQRKMGETRKLIVESLLKCPKTIEELAKELLVKQTTIRAHLKGHPNIRHHLTGLGIADKIDEKILRRGGYAKVGIYGIKNVDKAKEFLQK